MCFCHDDHGPTKVFILLYIGCHYSCSQMFKYCIILLFHDRNMAISSIKDTKYGIVVIIVALTLYLIGWFILRQDEHIINYEDDYNIDNELLTVSNGKLF